MRGDWGGSAGPRQPDGDRPLRSLPSQVFVEYANAGDSKAAQKLLTGRMFDGKFVVATFYPLSAYRRGYLYQTLL